MNWIGCETDLVVNNDMNGSANVEIIDPCHLHGLVNNSLASKGGIPVQ